MFFRKFPWTFSLSAILGMQLGLLASADDLVVTRNEFFPSVKETLRVYFSLLSTMFFSSCCFAIRYSQELKRIHEVLLYSNEVCCKQFFHSLLQTWWFHHGHRVDRRDAPTLKKKSRIKTRTHMNSWQHKDGKVWVWISDCPIYLGVSITSMSATFPGSSEPWLCALPRDAAALIVAATRLSSIVMRRLTQARCIVKGWKRQKYPLDVKLHRTHMSSSHANAYTYSEITEV